MREIGHEHLYEHIFHGEMSWFFHININMHIH